MHKHHVFQQLAISGRMAKVHRVQKPGIDSINFRWINEPRFFGTGVKGNL